MNDRHSPNTKPASRLSIVSDVELDGDLYNFSSYSHLGDLASIYRACFMSRLSRSEIIASRRRTNGNLYRRMKHFLVFASGHRGAEIDLNTYHAYKAFNEQQPYSAVYRYDLIVSFTMTARRAIALKLVHPFILPRTPSHMAVLALGNGGKTLADQLVGYNGQNATQGELNARIISALRELCWQRIHQIRDRQHNAQEWVRDRIAPNSTKTRDCLLKYAVQRLWHDAGGHSHYHAKDQEVQRVRREIADLYARRGFSIDWLEINDHLEPSNQHLAPFLVFFSIERINPQAIHDFKVGGMKEATADLSGRRRIINIEKGRAGRPLSRASVLGNKNARTAARAYQILEDLTARLREMAPSELKDDLFLSMKGGDRGFPKVYKPLLVSMMREFHILINNSVDPQFDILKHIGGRWCASRIRVTSANVHRAKGDHAKVQRGLRHRKGETTDGYLSNPETKAMLDDAIEFAQSSLLTIVEKGYAMLPANAESIAETTGLDESTAEALVNDEFNLGMGVSLISTDAYVIDTPLNCLRMQTWLKTLHDAQERLENSNPLRWHARYEPEIALFARAIEDFPRSTRAAAEQLGETTKISFPEPF